MRHAGGDGTVTVPVESVSDALEEAGGVPDIRESIRIQALLADIGTRMGMQIWIPRSDRAGVMAEWKAAAATLLDRLPLNYDDATLKTIEQIDVLWLKGRAIMR